MSRFRMPIALVAAILLVLAARSFAPSRTEAGPARRALLSADRLDPERVERIRIERGDEAVVFVRDGVQWRQTVPVVHALDAWSVRQLVSKVRALDVVRALEDAPAPGDAAEDPRFAPILGRIVFTEAAEDETADETADDEAPDDETARARTTVVELAGVSEAGRLPASKGIRRGSSWSTARCTTSSSIATCASSDAETSSSRSARSES